MYNKKDCEHIIKKYNLCYLSYNAVLLKNQHTHYFICKLFIITLFIIFNCLVNVTAGTIYEQTTAVTDHLTPFKFLRKNGDLPVTYLSTLHVADAELQKELSEHKACPFFSTLATKKKPSAAREPLHPQALFKDLNDLITHHKRIEYINKNRTIQLIKFPIFSWLLKEYSHFYDEEKSADLLKTITIEGMLFDLLYRVKNNDAVAKLVVDFLNRPVKITLSQPDSQQSLITQCKQYFLKLLFAKKAEKSFSEEITSLTSSPYTEEKDKQQKLLKLIKAGYDYNKNYIFTSYEPDENGTNISVPSDHIILPAKQSQQLLNADYPVADNAYDTFNRTGVKFSDNYFTQMTALATLGLFFLPAANAFTASVIPSLQCTTSRVCNPDNTYLLYSNSFAMSLRSNPEGCFMLGENITLNQNHTLPVFNGCKRPFSGEFSTGNYTLSPGSRANPVFGCIDQATVIGRFNFCTNDSNPSLPVISHQVLNRNTIDIQQADSCKVQRPAFDNIIGDSNQIIFSGNSNEVRVANGAGIIAKHISGNNNKITTRQGELYDSPVVFTASGRSNNYYQQDMNITRYTDSYLTDNRLFTANTFTGSETNIVQNNIKGTLFTMNTGISNQDIPDTQNKNTNVFATNVDINIFPAQDKVRLTNSSDNSEQRTSFENNGRLEIFKNNTWLSVCEDTLDQKAAHASCKALGYKEAESEGLRLSLKQKLAATKLSSLPVHLNKQCTGYERNLRNCNETEINSSACLQNEEVFLACHNRALVTRARTRNGAFVLNILTDYTSNSVDRFETTNTGRGRVEFTAERINLDDSPDPFVSPYPAGFFYANFINRVCERMGFNGGKQIYPPSMPVFGHLTGENDAILQCNPIYPGVMTIRLTDRHNSDQFRANISPSGIGRLEVQANYNNNQSVFVGFCPENVDDNTVQLICQKFGFNTGIKSYLTAKPLDKLNITDSQTGVWNRFNCTTSNSCTLTGGFSDACSNPSENVVLMCNHSSPPVSEISRVAKNCSQLPATTALFSGSYSTDSACKHVNCPVKLWDINGVKASDTLRQQCEHTRQVDTTNSTDWLTVWNVRCENISDHCSCHLPHEQLLGFVAADTQYNEILSVSRQTYPHNESVNTQGLVLVRKLFSNEMPQALHPVNEELATGVLPIGHVIAEEHLLGMYPAENSTSVQLFWSSLENNNSAYHAETYNINGKPLVLTEDSVFIKDMNSQVITRHPINSITNNDTIKFTLNDSPSDNIYLPESVADTFTGTLKDGWLYLTATDNHDDGQIYVISYNLNENSWNPKRELVEGLNSKNIENYHMVINKYNQMQFLSHGQIGSIRPVLVSIPEFGGCVSFSTVKEAEKIELIPQETSKPDNRLAIISSVTAVASCLTAIATCYCSYFLRNYFCKSTKQNSHEVHKTEDRNIISAESKL
ncbi:MAG: scavenger receptor cysteine-rich domain-containing protein [Endozoicomonadaceae bacterium]|nr:scavenger receptor cysteine-rich domain-containing protein [Endozoicomonadaceae bacterium]